MEQFGFESEKEKDDNKYTSDNNIPQYTPKDEMPDVGEIINFEKAKELIEAIENADITDEEKVFLTIASYRHAIIDFDKAADYYAGASITMQKLMEENALVIIDIDDAIKMGYSTLSETLDDIMSKDINEDE